MDVNRNDGRSYWDRQARRYDRAMRLFRGPVRGMIERAAEEVYGLGDVLEVAAGTGLVTAALARSARHVVATDYSAAMVEALRRRLAAERLSNVEPLARDLHALGLPSASFDAVVCANVLHLLPEPERALAGLRGLLRPGGRLIAPTFVHAETWLARAASGALALTGFPGQRRLTTRGLVHLLGRAGISVQRAETLPGLLPIAYVSGTVR
jgi:ubiquinone/menaquinone biosynthesis C-methylase UbiE